MNYSQIPEKPLYANVGKVEKSKRTYFYERKDGSIICVEEKEAWELHKKGFKQIGVSNGEIFRQAVIESQKIFTESGLQAAQERIRKGERDEIEAARGKFQVPPNNDKIGNGASMLRI